jgi:hypothetical protein
VLAAQGPVLATAKSSPVTPLVRAVKPPSVPALSNVKVRGIVALVWPMATVPKSTATVPNSNTLS